MRDRQPRPWSTSASTGKPSLGGHQTLQDWDPAFQRGDAVDIYAIWGPNEGLSADRGPNAVPAIASQKLGERCGFLNSPEVVKELDY